MMRTQKMKRRVVFSLLATIFALIAVIFTTTAVYAAAPNVVTNNSAPSAFSTSGFTATEQCTNTQGTVTAYGTYYGTDTSYGGNQYQGGSRTSPFTWSDIITGLSSGYLYHYRAWARNSSGTGQGVDSIALTLPGAPSALTVTNAYASAFTLTWTNFVAETSPVTVTVYTRVQYKVGSYPTSYADGTTAIAWTTGTSGTLSGLPEDGGYYCFAAFTEVVYSGATSQASTTSSQAAASLIADVFWVGGTGNWSGTGGYHWAAVSNGTASQYNQPNSNFVTAHFDSHSFTAGSQTVTVDATVTCNSMIWTGVTNTPTLNGSYAIYIYGSLTFVAGMTNNYAGLIYFPGVSGTITCGNPLSCAVYINNGGSFTLQDAMNLGSQNLTVIGTLITNSQPVTTTGTISINVGATWAFNGAGSTVTCGTWTAAQSSLAWTAPATLNITGATTFTGAGLTYAIVNLQGSGTITITGANTFSQLNLVAGTTQTLTLPSSTTTTITAPSLSGSAGHIHTIQGSTTAAATISCATAYVWTYVDPIYSTISGSTWTASTGSIDGGNDVNWILPRYWVGHTANWNVTSSWAASSGGGIGASVPDSTHIAFFDANSFNAGGQTCTVNATASCYDMNWTGVTNSPNLTVSANLQIYHNLTLNTSIAQYGITGSSYIYWEGSSTACTLNTGGEGIGCAGIGTDTTFSGTLTFASALNTLGGSLAHNSGTINTANYTLTTGNFTETAATTRTLTLGSSTISCGTWQYSGSGLTLTANTSTINCSGNFSGGGLTTYNIVNLTGATPTIAGSNTFATLAFLSGAAQTIKFTDGTTTTVTTPTFSSTIGNIHALTGTSTGGWNLAKAGGGTITVSYCTITYSVASPANTWYYDSTCTYTSTSGWTANVPSITNSPASISFGAIRGGMTYYAYNQNTTPGYSNPVIAGQCYFTISNGAVGYTTISLKCSNTTGGNVWTLVSGTPTGDQFKIVAVYSGENPASGLVLTGSNQVFTTIAAAGTLLWDFEWITGGTSGLFSDGVGKSFTITITGS